LNQVINLCVYWHQSHPYFSLTACCSLAAQQVGTSTAAAAAAGDSQPPPDGSTEDPAAAAAAAAANSAATAELSRLFDKADFAVMQPLGQFNLGFIIARLRQDLFIVDQHAAGELFLICANSMKSSMAVSMQVWVYCFSCVLAAAW
jgi:DNA mismatch repair ATPase MutL